jgi:hypothetical protein
MKRRKSPFRPRGAGTRKTTKIKTLRRAAVGERASPRTRNLPSTEADRARPRNLIEQPTTPAEEKLLANFSERVRARHTAPKVKVTLESAQPKVEWAGHPQTTLLAQLATFGTISPDFYSQTFGELQNASCSGPGRQFDEMEVNGMLAAMHGIAPRDEIEGMLAAQMVATYKAAMRCLGRLKNSEYVEEQDSHGNLAVKLLRTHVMQIEALQRYRGKGEQKVTVEHFHVHHGGQAIVGTLHRGEGGSPKIEGQPDAPAITPERRPALPSPDPQREAVPVPSRKR